MTNLRSSVENDRLVSVTGDITDNKRTKMNLDIRILSSCINDVV